MKKLAQEVGDSVAKKEKGTLCQISVRNAKVQRNIGKKLCSP